MLNSMRFVSIVSRASNPRNGSLNRFRMHYFNRPSPWCHLRLLHPDKADLAGIPVVVREEAHTSKVSFLDNEPVQHHDVYAGKRIARGLFRASDGRLINADVNGAYNILVKAAPDAFPQGRHGCVVQPVRMELPNRNHTRTNLALVS